MSLMRPDIPDRKPDSRRHQAKLEVERIRISIQMIKSGHWDATDFKNDEEVKEAIGIRTFNALCRQADKTRASRHRELQRAANRDRRRIERRLAKEIEEAERAGRSTISEERT